LAIFTFLAIARSALIREIHGRLVFPLTAITRSFPDQRHQRSSAVRFCLSITAIPRDNGDLGDLYLRLLRSSVFQGFALQIPGDLWQFWHCWQFQ